MKAKSLITKKYNNRKKKLKSLPLGSIRLKVNLAQRGQIKEFLIMEIIGLQSLEYSGEILVK